MAESDFGDKRFTTSKADGLVTIDAHGGEDADRWAIADKAKSAPVTVVTFVGGFRVTTRDEALASELCSALQSLGYRPA